MRRATDSRSWVPSIRLRIAQPNVGSVPEDVVVTADLDTGTEGLWLSEEHLASVGIERSPLNFFLAAKMGERGFQFYVRKLHISLIGSTGETEPRYIAAHVVKNFSSSPFSQHKPDRVALAGRDVVAEFGAIVEIDASRGVADVLLKDWRAFESDVADAYRQLGNSVRRDVSIDGNQIDILLERQLLSGRTERGIVACKYSPRPVDVATVRALAAVRDSLRTDMRVDGAAIVSSAGFTADAQLVGEALGIDLIESTQLFAEAEAADIPPAPEPETPAVATESGSLKRAFVIMPFSQDLLDTYVFGIREPLSANGYVCARTDELEFNGRVMDKIHDLIRNADLVVAEVTEHNANVYYELGVAHASGKAVVLCTKSIASAPFDIRDLNHIVYGSIRELREKLTQRVTSLIEPSS